MALRDPFTQLRFRPYFRYGLVGGALFALDLAVVLMLVWWAQVHPGIAQLVGRAIGASVGFLLHRWYTFAIPGGSGHRYDLTAQGFAYFVVAAATFLVSPLILVWFLTLTRDDLLIAKLLTEVVLVCINFFALRIVFSFRIGR